MTANGSTTSRVKVACGGALLVLFALFSALVGLPVSEGNVKESVHNLLADPTQEIPEESRDVCAFCHFPQSGTPQQPVWYQNGGVPKTAFATYPTVGVTRPLVEASAAVGNVSMACLSCHDGTHAQNIGIGHGGDNSHPVRVPYAKGRFVRIGGPFSTQVTLEGFAEPTFNAPEVDFINRVAVWWVETGEPGRQKSDMQLYTRKSASSNNEVPYVECATCHDPHSANPLFLRTDNAGSRVCLTCHLN